MISPMRKLSGVCRQSGSRPVQRLGGAESVSVLIVSRSAGAD